MPDETPEPGPSCWQVWRPVPFDTLYARVVVIALLAHGCSTGTMFSQNLNEYSHSPADAAGPSAVCGGSSRVLSCPTLCPDCPRRCSGSPACRIGRPPRRHLQTRSQRESPTPPAAPSRLLSLQRHDANRSIGYSTEFPLQFPAGCRSPAAPWLSGMAAIATVKRPHLLHPPASSWHLRVSKKTKHHQNHIVIPRYPIPSSVASLSRERVCRQRGQSGH